MDLDNCAPDHDRNRICQRKEIITIMMMGFGAIQDGKGSLKYGYRVIERQKDNGKR